MVVTEGSNVTLKCAATGSPAPTITWRREGGEPISLPGGVEGNSVEFSLNLTRSTLFMIDLNLCSLYSAP